MKMGATLRIVSRGGSLTRRHLHLLKQLSRHRVAQAPRDRHRTLALVGDIGGGA